MSFCFNDSVTLPPEAFNYYYRLPYPMNGRADLYQERIQPPLKEEFIRPVFRAYPYDTYLDIQQVHPFFASSSSSGHDWQSENDLPYRRIMIAEMYVYIISRNLFLDILTNI